MAKLTQTALIKIDTVSVRLKLAIVLKVSEQTIIRYISDNNDNLTKAAALSIIRKETGLTDKQILAEDAKVEA